jgi:hypothetical protein
MSRSYTSSTPHVPPWHVAGQLYFFFFLLLQFKSRIPVLLDVMKKLILFLKHVDFDDVLLGFGALVDSSVDANVSEKHTVSIFGAEVLQP